MRISLGSKLAASIWNNARYPDPTAQRRMMEELRLIALNQTEVMRLLNYEGEYRDSLDLNIDMGPTVLRSVQFNPLAGESVFPARISLYECDPFNQLLLASENLNAWAALRAHHKAPKPYGNEQTWIVWVNQVTLGLVRYEVSGNLAALRQNYPDLATLAELRDAGLDVTALRSPRGILRV